MPESPTARVTRKRRKTRKLVLVAMLGTILIYTMDGLRLATQVETIDLFKDMDQPFIAPNAAGYVSYGSNNILNRETTYTGSGSSGNEIKQMTHQYAPITNYNNDDMVPKTLSSHSNIHDSMLNDVAGKVAELLRDSSKKMEDMKLVVTFDKSHIPKASLPSGLRVSPGEPLPGQDIQLERNKPYKPSKHLLSRIKTSPHEIAGLHCTLYGGPNSAAATKEVVYWEDNIADSSYMSPFFHQNQNMADDDNVSFKVARDSNSKYISFVPDPGGFNNNRMAFEMYLVLSAAMGRTLVLPPKHHYPLMVSTRCYKHFFVCPTHFDLILFQQMLVWYHIEEGRFKTR